MSELKICRICLRGQCKVYKYDRFQLKPYYEEVMAMKVSDNDNLPQFFCYECATILHKYHKFKEKCYLGQNILKEINWRGCITYEAIYKIDRSSGLKSPLAILNLSNRVQTYTTKEIEDTVESGSDSESIKAESDEPEIKAIIQGTYNARNVNSKDDNLAAAINERQEDTVKDSQTNDGTKKDFVIHIEGSNCDSDSHRNKNTAHSPKTVFLNDKKEIIELENEILYEKKVDDIVEITKNTNNWKLTLMKDEEAVVEFRNKAEHSKYKNAKFKCTDCLTGFSKEVMLRRHRELKHDETAGNEECHFCHIRFKYKYKLRKHLDSHYTKYECVRCNLVLCHHSSILLHEDYHSGALKKCNFCGLEFKHQSTLYTHMRTHRGAFVCVTCGQSYVSLNGLRQHRRVAHVDTNTDSCEEDDPGDPYCIKCDIRFETRRAFAEHLRHSTLHGESQDDQPLDSENNKTNIPNKSLEKVKRSVEPMDKIPEEFKVRKLKHNIKLGGRKKRKKLKRMHKKPTNCHQCGKHFTTQAECMKHHLAEHPRTSFHAPSERHICEICGASLAPGSVAVHRNIHTRQTVHSCDFCGKQFHSSMGLKRHLLTHTGEKPYPCKECDKRFTQSNSLKLHYKTIHLKQPYPARNRKKANYLTKDKSNRKSISEESNSGLESDNRPQRETGDEMHYLTLN